MKKVTTVVKSTSFDFSNKFHGEGANGMWEFVELSRDLKEGSLQEEGGVDLGKGLPFFLERIGNGIGVVGGSPFKSKVSIRKYQK